MTIDIYDINHMWSTPLLTAIVLGSIFSISIGIFIFEILKGPDI